MPKGGVPIPIEPGTRFGRLTVVEPAPPRPKPGSPGRFDHRSRCVCDCGRETVVDNVHLRHGRTRSCGCLKTELSKSRRGEKCPSYKHGLRWTPLYYCWASIKGRCLNENDPAYKNYGGRGITLCGEWMEFTRFHDWATSNGYREGLMIDRIDNSRGYCPENCRFVDYVVNNNNKRDNVRIDYDGKSLTIAQWSREIHVPYCYIWAHNKKGDTIPEIVESYRKNRRAKP